MNAAPPRSRRSRFIPLFRGLGLALIVVLAGWGAPARAQTDNGLHGRIEVQDAGQFSKADSLLPEAANEALGNLRFAWQPTWGRWSLQIHYLVEVEDGPAVKLGRAERTLLSPPPATLFSLTGVLADEGEVLATDRVDRLAVTYTTPDLVVRVGRQALTWGSGLVFRPMDLFDPFSPTATDTEYKPGVDMVYLQRLFADGSDLQFIAAPRAEHQGGPVTADASSFALHFHTTVFGHPTTLLVARDHGDWVGAAGVNGALGGSTWNVEIVPTGVKEGGVYVSGLANISDAVTLAGRNATLFAEYFHNGFGVSSGPLTLTELPAPLKDRLVRGQLFTLRRDYLAGGMTLEATPLLQLSPSLIVGLNDGSLIALFAATYSLSDNATLVGGVQAPVGRGGTEFGGVPLTPSSPLRVAAPSQIYLQLRRYF